MKPTYNQVLAALEAILPIAECHLNWLMTQTDTASKVDSRDAEVKVSRALHVSELAAK